jgi:hypothetical protein
VARAQIRRRARSRLIKESMENHDDVAELLRANPDKLFVPGELLMKNGPQDYIGAAFSVRGTLYFDGSHTPEVRNAICECFAAYEVIANEHLRWLWRDEPPSGPNLLPYAKVKPMKTMMEKLRPDDLVSFAYTGGAKSEDASPWMFYVQGVRAWRAKMETAGLGALTFSVPPLFIEENPTAFQKLFVEFARLLKAAHGHAGFAFNLSLPREEPNESTEAFMATKMNGIDVGNPVVIGARGKCGIRDHIKTVGWLTAINYDMLEKVGGLARLRSELPVSWFAKYDYGNGLVIQAGAKPEIVSVEADPHPASYVLLNMALKDIRISEIGGIHYPSQHGEPRLYGWAAEQWVSRFDVPEDELMSFKTKLLVEPKLNKESTLPDQI